MKPAAVAIKADCRFHYARSIQSSSSEWVYPVARITSFPNPLPKTAADCGFGKCFRDLLILHRIAYGNMQEMRIRRPAISCASRRRNFETVPSFQGGIES